MLEGFETYSMSVGTASMTLSDNGVAFSKSAVIKMGKCPYVKLMIDYNGKRVAIVESTEEDDDSIQFYNPSKKLISVRWNNKELQNTIANLMGCELQSGVAYKVDGIYSYEDKALLFDLGKAREISTKNR